MSNIWMPIQEANELAKIYANMELEALRRQSYYFWNNFSMEGYEEWREKDISLEKFKMSKAEEEYLRQKEKQDGKSEG